jgi:alkylation response protein AidB-like acyl-CoA dehydrogenase
MVRCAPSSTGTIASPTDDHAERDGEGRAVNDQQVWTSDADIARDGLLLARTDPGAPKEPEGGLS